MKRDADWMKLSDYRCIFRFRVLSFCTTCAESQSHSLGRHSELEFAFAFHSSNDTMHNTIANYQSCPGLTDTQNSEFPSSPYKLVVMKVRSERICRSTMAGRRVRRRIRQKLST
jgi:hypothetical protein